MQKYNNFSYAENIAPVFYQHFINTVLYVIKHYFFCILKNMLYLCKQYVESCVSLVVYGKPKDKRRA